MILQDLCNGIVDVCICCFCSEVEGMEEKEKKKGISGSGGRRLSVFVSVVGLAKTVSLGTARLRVVTHTSQTLQGLHLLHQRFNPFFMDSPPLLPPFGLKVQSNSLTVQLDDARLSILHTWRIC